MFVVEKRIGERFPIGFDIETGETPTGLTVTIDPTESGGLEAWGSPGIGTDSVYQFVRGGILDRIYKVTLRITCTSGSIYEPMILVKIIY
jgi:hypothetical protein